MHLSKLIDNNRITLADTLRKIAPDYKQLSIATGYWDLAGTLEIINEIKNYDSIRLLIGKEPLSTRNQRALNIKETDNMFPDDDIRADLIDIVNPTNQASQNREQDKVSSLREVAITLSELLEAGRLQVKVFRKPFLHAKAYIFGSFDTDEPIGIIGSSNFTRSGLVGITDGGNAELNTPEQEALIVKYPVSDTSQYGHLSWFESMWNDPNAIPWDGEFSEILRSSPVGDLTFGPYDVYIKTLMDVFPDELIETESFDGDIAEVLYSFQNRNAGILLKKLERMGVAMLSDSVGLGKTITAGAVIRNYRDSKNASRIIVIAPASLKQQWGDDLGERFGLRANHDFEVVSMQDLNVIERLIEEGHKPWMKAVDLFVIDEAHNLRSAGSTRYAKILELLLDNPDSKVLLLTATPINNSLMDFANQIQLGSKGVLDSISVPYVRNDGKVEKVDFFEALNRIQSEARKEEKAGGVLDWDKYRNTIATGLRHYLVRSTRQGVEAEGGIISIDGTRREFPKSIVEQIEYGYDNDDVDMIAKAIDDEIATVFERVSVRHIDLDVASELTQQTEHPLDLYKKPPMPTLFSNAAIKSVIPNIFQVINLIGFTPYRPDLYMQKYHGKAVTDINTLLQAEASNSAEKRKIKIQMAIHNMLHITWLKRMESSAASLLKSVSYYQKRIALFNKYLDKGYIISLSDISLLQNEYDEDIERAFSDYDTYLSDVQKALDNEEDSSAIERQGVEKKIADPKIYNMDALKRDIERDIGITDMLTRVLTKLADPTTNGKLKAFAEYIERIIAEGKYGKKIVVFSFFSDTIEYLEESLPLVVTKIPDFNTRSAFITGGRGGKVEQVARRFSPVAKKYTLKEDETEYDFLFATDVLSEGQNLQDAGMLINYDLHWNPVRMIQRNGRINRLGSTYSEVLIANAMPHAELELFLRLVRRLERKIVTIKNAIGIDQGVLDNEINPIEFIEEYSEAANKIYSVNSEEASEALENLENTEDILSWTDDYSYELRRFASEHKDDGEIERLKAIPLGKWNYLPERKTKLAADTCLALERVTGRTSLTGVPINETLFISVNTTGRYVADYIDDADALASIKTTPEDNGRSKDAIRLDREIVARRAARQAKTKAESTESIYKLKPKQIEALTVLKDYFPIDLQSVVVKGLRNSLQKKTFERIVRHINREVKEGGSPNASTVSQFEILIKDLQSTASEDRQIDETINVLFYADRRS
ncbi:hypothetical protein AGMMS49983_17380 [Clostridia bacterium]|nr:hypothetical protein AGMMS49983_17380 [Clostridia bacterium]